MDAAGLARPVLMLVTDRHLAGGQDELVRKVSEAAAGGANVVQLREKDLDDTELLVLARRLRKAIAGRAKLLVNSRVDVAEAAKADGVHLSENAPRLACRPQYGLVGRSVHSLEAAHRAEDEGADCVVFGPVFSTRSHPGVSPSGVGALADVAGSVRIPVIAIGGITVERVAEVMDAGAAGVAVIRAILGAPSPRTAAEELSRELRAKVA